MPRNWIHAAGDDASDVLQHVGLLATAQQMAPHRNRSRRHVCRNGHRSGGHVRLVVHASRLVALSGVEYGFPLLDQHHHLQSQSATSVRRLLHAVGLSGDSKPVPEVENIDDQWPACGLSGDEAGATSQFAEASSLGVRDVLICVILLSLVCDAGDLLVF